MILLLIPLLSLVLCVPSVQAWGELGHQVVADLAQDMLTPRAKAEVAAILGPPSGGGSGGPGFRLSAISTWADEIKGLRPETRPWHYVTLQLADPGYAARRSGKAALPPPDSPNVVTALRASQKVLADAKADRYAREEALKWLVHLVGDLHQPLHVGEDRDKGGNLHKVKVGRRTHNLHAVWDYVLLERLNLPADSLRAVLAREIAAEPGFAARNAHGTVEDWVDETHAATRACYLIRGKAGGDAGEPLRKGIAQSLDRTYLRPATLAALLQLKRAAVRLAREINRSLDPAAPPAPPAPARVPAGWKADTSAWFASAKPDPGDSPEAPEAAGSPRSAPPHPPRTGSGVPSGPGKYAWSVRGKVHHYAACADAARIRPGNLRRGDDPPSDSRLHKGCPRRN